MTTTNRVHDVAVRAMAIYAEHVQAAAVDEYVDGGEYSGPAHDRQADAEVAALCTACGVDRGDVDAEVLRLGDEAEHAPCLVCGEPTPPERTSRDGDACPGCSRQLRDDEGGHGVLTVLIGLSIATTVAVVASGYAQQLTVTAARLINAVHVVLCTATATC